MKLSEQSRAILYLLMSVACLIWLVQSGNEAAKSGTFFTWPNLIFVFSLVIVSGYGIYAAFQSWRGSKDVDDDKKRDDENRDGE